MNPWAIAGLGVAVWAGGVAVSVNGMDNDSNAEQAVGGLLALGGLIATGTGIVLGVRDVAAEERPAPRRLKRRR